MGDRGQPDPTRASQRRDIKPIALTGFMGAGKSTVGCALARRLGWPFVDLDERLVSQFGPIAALVAAEGLPRFRELERREALSLCDGQARVLATGGGTILDPAVREAISSSYMLVFLDVPLDVARTRVGGGAGRPLWDDAVAARYEERQEIYRMAHARVDATLPAEVVAERIEKMLTASEPLGDPGESPCP